MDRRTARETAFQLLFEREFRKDEAGEDIIRAAGEAREAECNRYVEQVFFGVAEHQKEIDELIASCAIGWKTTRMTRVSLSILRIAVYEMKYCPDIPFTVSINEAVELTKKFDDDKAPAFINGILNAAAERLGLKNEKAGE